MATDNRDAGLWIRLSKPERTEIERESELSGFSLSDVARQRLFHDPMRKIDESLAKLESDNVTIKAWANLIAERIEIILPEPLRIGKKGLQLRLNSIKDNIRKAESLIQIDIENND